MGEGGPKVQTRSYKINKSWGCNVHHGRGEKMKKREMRL